jgi:hypothetical protein
MHKYFIAFLLLCCVFSFAHAVENSQSQPALVRSQTFLNRILYLSWDQAFTVIAEAHSTACHADRMALALRILQGQDAPLVAEGIVRSNAGGRVILGTVVTNADPNLVDSSASDLALTAAIQFYWNSIARCDTGT